MMEIDQGTVTLQEGMPFTETWDLELRAADGTTTAQDLTGAQAWGYITSDLSPTGSLLETLHAQIPNPTAGQVIISLSEAEVNALEPAAGEFADGDDREVAIGWMHAGLNHRPAVSTTITVVDQSNGHFAIAGDITDVLPGALATLAGATLTVAGSTGNDGSYQVTAAILNGANTDIYVAEAIPDATADGTLTLVYTEVLAQDQVDFRRHGVES